MTNFPQLCFSVSACVYTSNFNVQIHEKLKQYEKLSPTPVLHSASCLAEDVSAVTISWRIWIFSHLTPETLFQCCCEFVLFSVLLKLLSVCICVPLLQWFCFIVYFGSKQSGITKTKVNEWNLTGFYKIRHLECISIRDLKCWTWIVNWNTLNNIE